MNNCNISHFRRNKQDPKDWRYSPPSYVIIRIPTPNLSTHKILLNGLTSLFQEVMSCLNVRNGPVAQQAPTSSEVRVRGWVGPIGQRLWSWGDRDTPEPVNPTFHPWETCIAAPGCLCVCTQMSVCLYSGSAGLHPRLPALSVPRLHTEMI